MSEGVKSVRYNWNERTEIKELEDKQHNKKFIGTIYLKMWPLSWNLFVVIGEDIGFIWKSDIL